MRQQGVELELGVRVELLKPSVQGQRPVAGAGSTELHEDGGGGRLVALARAREEPTKPVGVRILSIERLLNSKTRTIELVRRDAEEQLDAVSAVRSHRRSAIAQATLVRADHRARGLDARS